MKTITTRITSLLMVFLAAVFFNASKAQTGVLNPDDPIVVYSSANPPATPPYGTLAKWVKTNRVSFTTTSFKAYFYKGISFRLKFPKTYKDSLSNPNKKYPIFVFFHGIGEKGTIYDNEYQLYHGGQKFRDYVDNGNFDGFLFYIQSSSGSGAFNATHYSVINELINNYFVPQIKVDINRVIVDGLSGGGGATWAMMQTYPRLVAAVLPISASSVANANASYIEASKFTPIWQFQGGLDVAPAPGTSKYVRDAFLAQGGNFKYTEYPTQGHGCWNSAWAEAQFAPFISKAHKANPWPLFGRTEFCPGDPISQVIGVTAGFDGYEWKKDSDPNPIPGATSNTITATSIGTYYCRIKRGTEWSVWSPIPVVLKLKGATISPDIEPNGLFSNVIPSPDGNSSVQLVVPEGYTSYNWQKDGDPTVLSTTRFLTATSAGNYKVKVAEQFGCSSEFSNLYPVIDANGPNGPPAASSVVATTLSKTAIKLDWSQISNPAFNETGFEIYTAPAAGGPYKYVTTTAANAITFTHTDLNPNTDYFYKLRAVNNTGASSVTTPVSAKTQADALAPTAPGNLRTASTTRNSVELIWDESSDDVGIFKYDIYVNGVKFYESDIPQATVFNLQHGQTYAFRVQARDFAGNKSPFSNQVTGQPLLNGLNYKYYTFTGTWNNLPNFALLDPDATGVVPNITLNNRTQDDNFAYLWEGFISITQAGTYNFRTNSDDGSRLWLGSLGGNTSPYTFAGTPLVNNDGLHGSQNATSANVNLSVGVYPIAIAFYEQGGGEAMTISWRRNSGSYSTIPNSAFQDPPQVNGTAPAAPSTLVATAISYKRINLTWTDLSNNETGFEVWRSIDGTDGSFSVVGNTAANITSFADSVGLDPSTRYFYQTRSIGQYGESALVPNTGSYTDAQAHWKFNNDYNDASGNGKTLTANSSPTFNTDEKEGSHSVDLNGTSSDITINTSAGDYLRGGYNVKSVVFWMKADATNDRGVFDFGGSDNGIAMRLNSNQLIAGIASNNTRRSISVAYTSTAWNHIALVYSTNTLRMYVNGVEVANNTSLGFTSLSSNSNGSIIGDDNGNTALNTAFGQFDGRFDNFAIFGRALTPAEINSIMANTYATVNATTLALPALPAAPTSLVASGTSTSTIDVTWNDNATTETRYELFRSAGNNSNFILYKTFAPNTTSFQDTALFSNSIFYYKVRAANEGGNTVFSNEDSAITKNNVPVLAQFEDQFMRHSTQLVLNIQATDPDPETLSVLVTNLPSFGVYTPTGNGTGTITFNPGPGHVGFYSNITVQVTDEHGGVVNTVFDLTVNSNDNPVVSNVSDVILSEQQNAQVNITATDANATDVLVFSFTNLPSFATPVAGTNSIQLNLAPGYAANGVYHVGVRVDDGNDGFDTTSFNITVNDVNPNKTIYVNFNDGSIAGPGAPWNNTAKVPAVNDNFPNLKDDAGATTTVGVQLTGATTFTANNAGSNTGSNTGVYPDAVLRTSYNVGTASRTLRIYGLTVGDTYTFTFLGSRAAPTVGVITTYAIGATTVSLNAANNTSNTVSITDVLPAPDGSVVLTVGAAVGSSFGYLNSIVIRSLYDDGTAPAKPRNLAAETFNSNVRLTWVDAAYNEQAYEVYRSTSLNSGYQLLNPGGNNAGLQQYDDGNVQGHTTYYYYVRAANGYGSSNSDTISFVTPNTAPILAPIANINMSTQQVLDVNVTATDEPGETIVLTATGLPAFATFTDNHNGTGVLHLAPGNTSGQFNNITITATDNSNATSSDQFNISVSNPNISNTYINFNQTLPAAAPWNNMNSAPVVNATIPNLLDNAGVATGASVTLLDAWTAQTATGFTTGNNSGLYPDNVMITSYYYSTAANTRRIRLSGLSATKRYNLVFFASRNNYATPLTTRYTVGAQSVDLNAQNNTTNTVQLNDLAPDASGQITITAQAVVGPNSYIGAMVVQAYTPDLNNPVAPTGLTAVGVSKTQISLNWATTANTGYEVWRSSTPNGTYTKRADIPANVTTYADNGLTAATAYYYKVKTVINGIPSPFSTYAGASTVAYTILLNMNDGTAGAPAQGGNWNNTNALIADGYVLPNMINDEGQNTGIDFNVVTTFSGFNYSGTVTGNNSGVYPDNTMKSFYYCNFADTARLKITGLTLAHAYNFVFFGSRANPLVGVITAYQVGSKLVTLNAANNTSNVVKITGLIPEPDGSISIKIYGTTSGGFGYLNVFSIEGAPAVGSEMLARTAGQGKTTTAATVDAEATKPAPATINDPIGAADVYPNPFTDDVTLKFELKENVSRFTIAVVDLSGKIVYQREVANAPQGTWIQKLGLKGQTLGRGVYFVRVLGIPGHDQNDLKIIRQ
jgi:predicted esterase